MPRLPFQVGIFPYRKSAGGGWDYAVFRREAEDYWQCIAGGGEDAEAPLDAARREALEEAGIAITSEFLPLQTTASVPVYHFRARDLWDKSVLVIPVYYFGVRVNSADIELSGEHSEYAWKQLEGAQSLLRWDSDKTALWELHQRLHRAENSF